ncbi:hypothetical protein [Paenibacillus sp. Root444D2]|uniref:hypothetical protein n=1 Tax=Paenibacillus sp. Root444D2 TaxID=1736538 RepID=UPI00070EE149|nr:hypothetical protein [Paenibacillus sp. Root444D2]KQX45866.1 hypothetical protein ASD40_18700 [Paenibacillus sp. Root444D2]
MEKDVWKWFFNELSDKSIVSLICGINQTLTSKLRIAVKGISDISKLKTDQIRLFRSRIETELNKPQNTNKVKVFLRKSNELTNPKNKEAMKALSVKDADVIWEEIQAFDSITVNEMIMYLMIQNDQVPINKGIQLHEKIMAEVINDDDRSEFVLEAEDTESKVTIFDLEERQELLNELERFREENKIIQEQIKKLQEEKKEALKINRDLKKKISQVEGDKNEADKTIQRLEKENKTRKDETNVWITKYQELQEELRQSQQEQVELKNETANLNQHLKEVTEEKNLLEKNEKLVPKRSVMIIDRNMPDGLKTRESTNIHLIMPNQLEQIMLTDSLDHSDEIWFLTFKLSAQKQSLLNKKYGTKVMGFSTYNELKNYCNSH